MCWTHFSHDAMLVVSGMGSGLILAYAGGLWLWGGMCLLLVALILFQAWRADNRPAYAHEEPER